MRNNKINGLVYASIYFKNDIVSDSFKIVIMKSFVSRSNKRHACSFVV